MSYKYNTIKNPKSFWVKCFGSNNIPYFVCAVGVIILTIYVIFISRDLSQTKFQLESCRSSQ